jgi:serine/threonine-protein kinase
VPCSACSAALTEGARFCASCGRAVSEGAAPATRQPAYAAPGLMTGALTAPAGGPSPAGVPSATSSSGWLSSSDSIDHGRFAPGAVLDGRYRIIGLLGKGGMGEVHRADDLRLGQPVALKFLPSRLRDDPVRLARFHNEVRTARQIAHPNVCRVYDVGEAEGHLFLSMEYVDGEDLATSLRRIGRFPEDKATEIARQLCAGLSAAHDRGVLHRDLKPANVMLDRDGKVRLMDFGLAAIGPVDDVRAGTPAYMAPEQLSGQEVTKRSDIFSLGLILYELYTGRRAFTAATIPDLAALHQSGAVTPPGSIVRGLNGMVERAILRCLEPRPDRRPSSALAVAAGLPGGDPLAAALAAGETPSPEMVAAAGEGIGLAPRTAAAVFAGALAGIAIVVIVLLRLAALDLMRPAFPPEVMAQKARDAIAGLGYATPARDDAYGYGWNDDLMEHVQREDAPAPDWRRVLTQAPSPLYFWYRRSDAPLTGLWFKSDLLTPGIVDQEDPPAVFAGMVQLRLDHRGRLIYFEAIPPQVQKRPASAGASDWDALFSIAGLDPTALQPAEPEWNWLAASDTRAAWTGRWPESGRPLRVEAAALDGRPVAFLMAGPWQRPWRAVETSSNDTVPLLVVGAIALGLLTGATLLARRHLQEGRGDRAGALRLAVFTSVSMLVLWAFRVHLTASLGLLGTLLVAIATAVFNGVLMWTVYIAIEPVVRRRWPQALVSWTTIFSGRVRDPIVGRDVLLGVALGVVWTLILVTVDVATRAYAVSPYSMATELLNGTRSAVASLIEQAISSVRTALLFFLMLFLWRVVLRRQWAAVVAFAATFGALDMLGGDRPFIIGPMTFAVLLMAAFVVVRWGLLSLAVGVMTTGVLLSAPVSGDLGGWYVSSTVLFIGSVLALATWALRTSAGTRLQMHNVK